MNDEFFIGWQARTPLKTSRFLKKMTLASLAIAIGLAAVIPALQQTISPGADLDLKTREFTGVMVKSPVPLIVTEEGEVRFLVNPFKFGFDAETADQFHLHHVSLQGKLISNDGQAMIEVLPESVRRVAGDAVTSNPLGMATNLGEVTLRGEIVDSKCYLGVMNPGNLKPHRACAVNCISGGVPPVLMVRDREGAANYFLIMGEDGRALNDEILPWVAEPVSATGILRKIGGLRILYLAPRNITIDQTS